ncbi:type II toxin-antitoxin system PemK/MazF family toxin [Ferrovibrio sp.]|uniref:type II toxin-antitoxin system PemK/MazF family toxin n=1 Tax=Ferrovibrio sp. TaxID=1917215 RepID=UPI0025C4C31E|nr:type II toxin-antitoxin system PemK/MazF family toxin [Ferrovibrio sp.]MBX3453553.1 type II toxin-antitoxin system PemK/MazF family toxin [Ferrovibrio sp.]
MPRFEAWETVSVPFPYTDRDLAPRRPALVISLPDLEAQTGQIWVVMITSAENRKRAGDVVIADLTAAGLPIASLCRPSKIATIDAAMARPLGHLAKAERRAVLKSLRGFLALKT